MNWGYFTVLVNVIIAFLLLFSILELIRRLRMRVLRSALLFLGTLSMFMWFIHGLFFTGRNYLQPQIYAAGEPLLIFIVCLMVTIPLSWICHKAHMRLFSSRRSKETKQ